MKREFLKELGIEDELIDKVMAEHGKTVETHKAATAEKSAALETANATIKDLQDAVKKFDGVDLAALNQQITDLQTKYDTDIAAAKLGGALETALVSAKAKNNKAVKALLDMEKITLDGDTLKGLDEQIKALSESDPYLFDLEDGTKSKVDSGKPHGGSAGATESAALRAAFGLKE